MNDTENLVVLVSFGNSDMADAAARALVAERLAACVHVVAGVTAVYRWKEKMEVEPQAVLVAKTTRSAYPQLEARTRQLHSDVVPEIIALPIVEGLPAYLEWLGAEVKPGA